jgi:hypothetical protein
MNNRYHNHTMKRERDFERSNSISRHNLTAADLGFSKMFGKLADEYEIYKACAPTPHKSFDEWLKS